MRSRELQQLLRTDAEVVCSLARVKIGIVLAAQAGNR